MKLYNLSSAHLSKCQSSLMNIWLFYFSLKFPIRKPTKRPLSSRGVRLPSQRFYLLLHESNGAPMLGLLAVSRVDAVSVLGTLSRDKAAVPGRLECCRSRGGRESGVEGGSGGGGGLRAERLRISVGGLTDSVGSVASFTPARCGCRQWCTTPSTIWSQLWTNDFL